MSDLVGIVYFVGAGPGDEGLITVKGAEKLKSCDVVIYDRLACEGLLNYTKPGCKKIYAGKQAGMHYKKQEEINQILVDYALPDNVVVRLKGGDPFVFGRGTEEIEALEKCNIPYEVIPGVTSAIAVPECAGIPVTHRGVSRSFHVITGRTNTATGVPDCNYKALAAAGGTLIFMMGLANINEIAVSLIKEGMPEDTPVAVISGGTTERQKVLRSQLGRISKEVKENNMFSPAVIIAGETASYNYNYNKNKLCFSKKTAGIVATRVLREKIEEGLRISGTACVPVCDMEVEAVSAEGLIKELEDIEKYNWIVFTSRNGVMLFFDALRNSHTDIRRLSGIKFAVIGNGTEQQLNEYGINADFVPSEYTSAVLAKELSKIILPGETVLLPRAVQGSRELTDIFTKESILFKELKIYYVKGHLMPGADYLEQLSCIIFLSASGVREFARLVKENGKELPEGIKFVCIGEVTRKALEEEYGMKACIITAEGNNAEGVMDIVKEM